MLLTGKEYLESIRDGRRVYVGGELVDDVTTHPAFRNAAHSFAMIYDRKRAPENRDVMTFEEDGETFSSYFLLPRTREDLQRRFETHRRIASWTLRAARPLAGQFPELRERAGHGPGDVRPHPPGLRRQHANYYRHMRANDIFASHTVTNPQGWRMPIRPRRQKRTPPTLRVVAEDDRGVTINGLKMLGTASVFCHETWCGNLQPVAPGPGEGVDHLRGAAERAGREHLVAQALRALRRERVRQSARGALRRERRAVLFENVQVPWERVFCHDNVEMTRAIYMRTPGHAMANHQANVRFLEKLKLIVGIASKLADMNGARGVPAVQFTLGRLAAMEATLEGLIMGQINCGEAQVPGYHTVNRRYVYAALHWCTNHHAEICDMVRELMGAGVFQMPADASVLTDDELRARPFETYWSVPGQSAQERMKLLKLAWDLLGSDFAGRHMQYEKFYAGPGFVMNSYSYLTGPWAEWEGAVDELLASLRHAGAYAEKITAQSALIMPLDRRAIGYWSGHDPMPCFSIAAGTRRQSIQRPHLSPGEAASLYRDRPRRGGSECANARNILHFDDGLAAGVLALLAAQPAAHAQADKTFVMKLSTATLNDTQHEWLKRFAAAVEKDSGGRIKGEVYPASQLGPIPRQIEGVQFGSIQGWMGPPEFLVGVDARFETVSAPGLFSSPDQAERVISDAAVQKMMFGLGEAKGLKARASRRSDRRPSSCARRSRRSPTSRDRRSACWRRRSSLS